MAANTIKKKVMTTEFRFMENRRNNKERCLENITVRKQQNIKAVETVRM